MNRQDYLHDLERRFLSLPRRDPAAIAKSPDQVEGLGGVYGIWEESKLRYFGEICHLNHRLLEIAVIGRHHSLNLLMGTEALGKKGREKTAWLCRSLFRVSWMPVDIGRAEFEEYILLKYAADLKNHQGVRFRLRSDFSEWCELIKAPIPQGGTIADAQDHIRTSSAAEVHRQPPSESP